MGQPTFRFTLIHDQLGTKIISEPDGWKEAKLKLERHPDFHSMVEYFEGEFIFYGSNGIDDGGVDFIKNVENIYGVDAIIEFYADVSFDGVDFENIFTGNLDLSTLQELKNNKIACDIIRSNLWSRFINRRESPVNIQSTTDIFDNVVTPATPITLHLTSQTLRQKYVAHVKNNQLFTDAGPSDKYGVLDFDVVEYEEIDETFHYTLGEASSLPFEKFFVQYDGDFIVDCKITLGDRPSSTIVGYHNKFSTTIGKIQVYLQVNGSTPIQFTETDVNISSQSVTLNNGTVTTLEASVITEYTLSTTLKLKKNDSVRIYTFQDSANATTFAAHIFGQDGDGRAIGSVDTINPSSSDPDNTLGFEQGLYDPSLGTFPSPANANEYWEISQDGTIQGVPVLKGWIVRAKINTPGQAVSNWYISDRNYTENLYRLGQSYLNVTFNSLYQQTDGVGFLLHDAFAAVIERITGQQNSFYSEFLGSTQTNYRSYLEDGCGWRFALIKGLQLRGYHLSDKPFFASFDDLWKGADPILNLGLGYDVINGHEVIRIEPKEYFYDTSNTSVLIDNVLDVVREYDNQRIFKKINVGYSKWQSEDVSGIDDPQTKHTYNTIFKQTGKDLDLISSFIAASLAIETTRRQTIEKSRDYKFDNEIFIIAINETPSSPDRYYPELDENFDSISNLLSSESRYNLILTPLRNLLRWGNYINGCLQKYQSSSIKFASGEGNYDMISDYHCTGNDCAGTSAIICSSVSEKQDIDLSTYGSGFGFIHLPDWYKIDIDLSWDDYKAMRTNRNLSVGISQTENGHKKMLNKVVTYEICKSKCKQEVWAGENMQLQVIS